MDVFSSLRITRGRGSLEIVNNFLLYVLLMFNVKNEEGGRAVMSPAKWPSEPPSKLGKTDSVTLATSPSLLPLCLRALHFYIRFMFLFFIYILWFNQPIIKIFFFSIHSQIAQRIKIHKFQIWINLIDHNFCMCKGLQ